MKKVLKATKNIVFVLTAILLFVTMSNKAYAYLGMTDLEARLMEKYTGKKFDEGGALVIYPGEYDEELLSLQIACEHNYFMGYYEKEYNSFLVGYEYEKASDDFFASKGRSIEVLELESGWDDSFIQKYVNDPNGAEQAEKDGKAARLKNDKAKKAVSSTSTGAGRIKNVTKYKGVDYSAEFNAQFYYDSYPDLQKAIGKNGSKLLEHYVKYGKAEGRIAK